eukprot:scaffold3129_cov125-Skeletonema_dohrnii-CCMP3373.AAC.1
MAPIGSSKNDPNGAEDRFGANEYVSHRQDQSVLTLLVTGYMKDQSAEANVKIIGNGEESPCEEHNTEVSQQYYYVGGRGRVMELKQHVRIAMPWDDHAINFAEAILAGYICRVQFNNQKRMEKKIDELPSRFEGLLDERRQMNGPIILAQMQKLVDRSTVVNGLVQTVNSMRVINA